MKDCIFCVFGIDTDSKLFVHYLKHIHENFIALDMYFYDQNPLLCHWSLCVTCFYISIPEFLALMPSQSLKDRII